MAYDIELTNDAGVSLLGSDGHFNVDKRLGFGRVKAEVQEYAKRFELNFKWKFDHWTHFKYKGKLYPIW